tara:strand:- start:807 stop:1043 length:237 start_codon:yes stop_codon:yes gene_type:complete
MRYIFLAEANTEPSLLKDYLMDFLGRMLKLDVYAIDPEILDIVLAEMEVFVDVDKEKIILVYEDGQDRGKQTQFPYGI